jgi:transposase-like protein
MIYAGTKQEIETKRKAFIRKWRLKCDAVADSLEEAGNKLFTFPRFPESQWKSIRTSNGIERLHEECGSRPRPFCPRRKQRPCCFGLCWLLPDHDDGTSGEDDQHSVGCA